MTFGDANFNSVDFHFFKDVNVEAVLPQDFLKRRPVLRGEGVLGAGSYILWNVQSPFAAGSFSFWIDQLVFLFYCKVIVMVISCAFEVIVNISLIKTTNNVYLYASIVFFFFKKKISAVQKFKTCLLLRCDSQHILLQCKQSIIKMSASDLFFV